MEFRVSNWINTQNFEPKFGIQARREKGDKWHHLARQGKALIFDNEEQAKVELEAIKKLSLS